MATDVVVEPPAEGAFSRRLRDRIYVWRRLFSQNWNLFKASRIGVIGLAIMIAFVVLALAAPFMGLRDPIRWTAPDEDLIDIVTYWQADSSIPGSELRSAPPVNQPLTFRVWPDSFDPRSDRVYMSAGNRLYAFRTQANLDAQAGEKRNAWGTLSYFNVSADGVARTISVPPVVINWGHFVQVRPDYELYLGTDSGRLYIIRDLGDAEPAASSVRFFDLDGAITGLAAFNGDMEAPRAIEGTPVHTSLDNGSWADEPLAPSALEDLGEYTSIALNATDVPYIAYYHVGNGVPQVSRRTVAGWGTMAGLEPSSTTVNTGLYTSLALGSDGRPRVAYYDESDKSVKYAAWNGSAWIATYVESSSDVGRYTSLALDATDNPHIAYYNETSQRLMHAACSMGAGCADTGNWTVESVTPAGVDAGRSASLALDGAGNPHVVYFNATGFRLEYVAKNGTWQPPVVVDVWDGQYASLALDGAGRAAVAYYDAASRALKYADNASGTWSLPEFVDDPPRADVGRFASLAFGPTGPAIAYHDATSFDLKYARRNGTTWENATVNRTGHVGLYASLRFDSSGIPHIAHYSFRAGRTTQDIVVAGTATGRIYAFDVGIPGTIERLPREKRVTSWDYRQRWEGQVSSPVHIAGGPLEGVTNMPLYSPAFTADGAVVFSGTADGRLVANRTSDGSSHWTQTVRVGSPWSTAPVVQTAAEGPLAGRDIVYAASNVQTVDDPDTFSDETNYTFLHARLVDTGEALPQWLDRDVGFLGYGGATPVGPTILIRDGGNLTQPSVEGGTIFVGSTSGWLYAIRRDGTGALPPASIRWRYQDAVLMGLNARFTSPVLLLIHKLQLLVTANHDGGTPDPADDRGILYSFKMDGDVELPKIDGKPSWKKTFPVPIPGYVVSWMAPKAIDETAWVGYGGPTLTGISSLRSTGDFLAPSPPSWVRPYPSGNQYWLGLDSQGRDIFSQVIWGSRIALLVGFLSAFFSVVLGVVVGLIAGYVGGKTESILMRFTDVILVLPGLPLIITLAAVLGASIFNIVLVIALLGWPGIARIIRAEVLSLKERPFIDSARVTGASTTRIVFRHIAPNVLPLAFLYMTFAVSGAILTEAALSFIGLGDINTMSWGIMLQLVSQSKALTAWWWLLPPGLAITLISLSFFLVGRAFDEIVNPRLRKR